MDGKIVANVTDKDVDEEGTTLTRTGPVVIDCLDPLPGGGPGGLVRVAVSVTVLRLGVGEELTDIGLLADIIKTH